MRNKPSRGLALPGSAVENTALYRLSKCISTVMAQERKEERCERIDKGVKIGMDWVNICQTSGKIGTFWQPQTQKAI